MPEEPIPSPEEPTPSPEEPTPLEESSSPTANAEWTDDMDLSSPEEPSVAPDEAVLSSELRDEALDWEDEFVPEPPIPQSPSTREALAWLKPLWRRVKAAWRRILAGVRSRLPITAQLSDTILSGILIGILVLLLTIINGLRQPPAIAKVPPLAPSAPVSRDTSPSSIADGASDLDAPELEASELDRLPEVLEPEAPATEVPEPELDPAERERIAAIQTQLMDASLSYGNNLLVSAQADLTHNQLTANLSSGWYGLSAPAQEDLANDWLRRSIEMNFAELELRSPDGLLLARSPVIGEQMVILQRQQPPVVEAPPRPRYRIVVDR